MKMLKKVIVFKVPLDLAPKLILDIPLIRYRDGTLM